MSQAADALYAIYIEGETKTGKGAASEAISNALKDQGLKVYYDVAGDFFRRFTATIRKQLQLGINDPLPARDALISIAKQLYQNGQAFSLDADLGDLQRPEISNCVSQLGELPIAQEAAVDWYAQSVKQAVASGAKVMVLDGRNPRRHVEQNVNNQAVQTILDIYMTCEPGVAARRVLLGEGNAQPTASQLQPIMDNIADRRWRDRQRAEWPFWWPDVYLPFVPGQDSVAATIKASRQSSENIPLPIVIDNSYVPKPIMWAAVEGLAVGALAAASGV